MSPAERTIQELRRLPPEVQSEVLDFVEFLKHRKARKENQEFTDFSLHAAMRGMEEEPEIYSESDIREPIS